MESNNYSVYRYYQTKGMRKRLLRTGLTLTQAQKWCNDPETSSKTMSTRNHCASEWFDGYTDK